MSISADLNVITPDLLERADKVRVLLDEVTSVSDLAAHGLREHRQDLRAASTRPSGWPRSSTPSSAWPATAYAA